MSKFGIIFSAYNAQPYLSNALDPWIMARKTRLGGHEFVICAVSVPFEGFNQSRNDDTLDILAVSALFGKIDHVVHQDVPMKETEARGAALKWLVDQGVEASWIVDSDEFYTIAEIEQISSFVEASPLISLFRLCLKNYVFDSKTYLVEPFTPPRIHRIRPYQSTAVACGFWDDNNVEYFRKSGKFHDIQLPGLTVPKSCAFVSHASWLNDERSKRKILYQNSRPGWKCSFDWDDFRGGLIWRDGFPIPETAQD